MPRFTLAHRGRFVASIAATALIGTSFLAAPAQALPQPPGGGGSISVGGSAGAGGAVKVTKPSAGSLPKASLPTEPALPKPALPKPALPKPALPKPALPKPALPKPALPKPALPKPALPKPALPGTPGTPSVPQLPAPSSGTPGGTTGGSSTSGSVADVRVGDRSILGVGGTRAGVGPQGRATSSASVLSLFGRSILGSSADSRGPQRAQLLTDSLTSLLCAASSGGLCLDLLSAESTATRSGGASTAESRTAIARLCVGGDDPSGRTCDGPIRLGVADGRSFVFTQDGRSTTFSRAALADLCVAVDPSGSCTLDVEALTSESSSDSERGSSGSSTVLGAGLAGRDLIVLQDPFALAVLSAQCGESSLACVLLNQARQGTGMDAAQRTQALTVGLLPGLRLLGINLADTTAQAAGARGDGGGNGGGNGGDGGGNGGSVVAGASGGVTGADGLGDGAVGAVGADAVASGSGSGEAQAAGAARDGGLLPNTGGPAGWLLGLGGLLLGAGALVLRRRRETAED